MHCARRDIRDSELVAGMQGKYVKLVSSQLIAGLSFSISP